MKHRYKIVRVDGRLMQENIVYFVDKKNNLYSYKTCGYVNEKFRKDEREYAYRNIALVKYYEGFGGKTISNVLIKI